VRLLPWIGVLAAYVAAALALDASDPAAQTPLLLDRLSPGAADLVLTVPAVAAFACAAALARRWVPDPWATRATLLVALSPLGFALGSGSRPDAPAAALLAAGLLLALKLRDEVTQTRGLAAAACLALAPWFGLAYAFASVPPLLALVSWTARRGRRLLALLELEIAGASAVALFEADTPVSRAATDGEGIERVGNVVVDVLRWAPLLALAFVGAYLLLRSRRERVARAIPLRRDAEVAAALTGLVLVILWAVAAFGSLGPGAGVPLAAAFAAWGMHRVPRLGALLGLAGIGLTAWMIVALGSGDAHGWLDLAAF
jgi:hypothetical protein